MVRDATADDEIADHLWSTATVSPDVLGARLARVTVADVPGDLRPDFQRLYGKSVPPDRLVFDVLEADVARAFAGRAEPCAADMWLGQG